MLSLHAVKFLPLQCAERGQCRHAACFNRKALNVKFARLSVPTTRCRLRHVAAATESSTSSVPEGDEEDSELGQLLPEEDWVVPGTYEDAMKAGTKLGKAVQGACDELATLGSIETDVLNEAQQLLQSVGFKGSLFQAPTPPAAEQEEGAPDQDGSDA